MKARIFILSGLCMLSLLVLKANVNNPKSISSFHNTSDIPPGYEELELQGSLMLNAGPNSIEVYVYQNSVYVYFHQNFGVVHITLYDSNAMIIYNDVVNTAVQQLVVIPITALNEGIYTIVLENTFGYADGEFEKQP